MEKNLERTPIGSCRLGRPSGPLCLSTVRIRKPKRTGCSLLSKNLSPVWFTYGATVCPGKITVSKNGQGTGQVSRSEKRAAHGPHRNNNVRRPYYD